MSLILSVVEHGIYTAYTAPEVTRNNLRRAGDHRTDDYTATPARSTLSEEDGPNKNAAFV